MFQIHSLRTKFISIFLMAMLASSSAFYFIWLPYHFEEEKTQHLNETKLKFNLLKLTVEQFYNNHKQYDNSDSSLFKKVITEQMSLYKDWVDIIVYSNNDEIYFELHKKNNYRVEIFKSDIYSFNEKVGFLELKVSPKIFVISIQQQIKDLSILFFTLLLLLLFVVLLIQEYLIQKPLFQLNSATKSIMLGDFNFNLIVTNQDEIGELTKSFIKMKSSLIESHNELQTKIETSKLIATAFSNSEEQLRTIIENIADGMVIFDDKGCIELYNPAFSKMLDYSNHELSGKNISSIVISEHTKCHDNYISQYLSGSKGNIVNQRIQELSAVTKDGNKIPIGITINDYLANNSHHFVAMLRDISDRKEAERKVKSERDKAQLYLDTAQVAIFSLNRNGNIILANQKSCEIFDFSESELLSKNWFDLIPEIEIKQPLKNTYDLQMNQQDEMPEYFFLTMSNKSNEYRILEWHCKVLMDKNENPAGMIISGMDVTQNRNAEIEKNQLRKQLLQSQKMEAIGQLTGGIAHDFNNILAGMMGYTEMLLERENENPDKRKLEYLNLVYESGERATDLIQKMLSYSRGISTVKKQSLYLPGMVKDVMKMLTSVIPSSVEIKTNFNKNVPNIDCDSISIQQIIMNLCINARDAMNNKGKIILNIEYDKQINVDCTSCGKAIHGEFVVLSVRDSGSGINKSNLQHLFEPFFSTKDVGKGSGMGLSVIHGLLHEVNAHIVVESELDKGTIFTVYFPRASINQDIQVA